MKRIMIPRKLANEIAAAVRRGKEASRRMEAREWTHRRGEEHVKCPRGADAHGIGRSFVAIVATPMDGFGYDGVIELRQAGPAAPHGALEYPEQAGAPALLYVEKP